MSVNREAYKKIKTECDSAGVTLVAVSKTKPNEDLLELYELGHRDFGENYVQELTAKYEFLPKDIRWHFIGHLQSNKAKYIAPFVHMIHGIDSAKLLQEVNKQAAKNNRVINCLLQVHIAMEETKFGFDEAELESLYTSEQLVAFNNISIKGLMGMASFSNDVELVKSEFTRLNMLYNKVLATLPGINTLSMGMSADYHLAISCGSNMIRVGSLLFGARNYNT